MANPQTENGFTSIANELLEALARTRFPGLDRQVFDYIMRETYGWKRKEAPISLEQFVEATGLRKTRVCESLKNLKARKIITEKRNRWPHLYGVQKNYGIWSEITEKRKESRQPTTPQEDAQNDYGKPESEITDFRNKGGQVVIGQDDNETRQGNKELSETKTIPENRNGETKTIPENRNDAASTPIGEKNLQPPKESTATANKKTCTTSSQIEDLLTQFPDRLHIQLQNLLELSRLENKTQKITDGRRFTLLKSLLKTYQDYPDHFEAALDATVAKEIPNPNYVRAVAKHRQAKGGEASPVGLSACCQAPVVFGLSGSREVKRCQKCNKEI